MNPNSNILLRRIHWLLPILMLIAGTTLHAGDIVGRVNDANTGRYLPGVAITIAETGRTAITGPDGRFTFNDLPAGSYTLQGGFVGYADVSQRVEVPATGEVTASLAFGEEVLKLEKFAVEGIREGRSLALQQKRTALNLKDIISADSVGNLPDRNVAEALSRLAGLSISQSSGEGQFVTIRGVEPNLNNVTFNGVTVAPPGVGGRSGRATQLDIIASSQISQVEVIKSVTPDMDANALGGTINIKTVSGFDRNERYIYGDVEGGENRLSKGSVYGADFTYGDVFGKNRTFGVAFAGSYSNRHVVNDNVRASWTEDGGTGNFYPEDLRLIAENGERERIGLNLNLEYRPDDNTELFVRSIYNIFNEKTHQDDTQVSVRSTPVFVSPTSITYDRIRYEPKVFDDDAKQTLTNVTAGGSKKFGRLTAKAQMTYSRGKEVSPAFRGVQFRTGNVNAPSGQLFSTDFTNYYWTLDDKNALTAPTTVLPFRRFRIDDSLTIEDTYTPQGDLQWDFDNWMGGRKGFMKVGAKYTDRSRFVDNNSSRPSGNTLIQTMGAALPGYRFFDGQYMVPLAINSAASLAYLKANPASFPDNQLNSIQNSVEDDFDIKEQIAAAYAMVSVDVNPKLTVMGGFRFEHTKARVTGWEVQQNSTNTDTGALLGGLVENTGRTSYDDYLPNVQFRYEITKQLVLRGAFTGTMGRPAYEDASPIAVFIAEPVTLDPNPAFPNTGSLEIGNPELKPFRSHNFDLALEYYTKSGATFSLSAFRKDIDNPIFNFSETRRNTVHNGIALESLAVTTTKNAKKGTINGLEVNLQLPFSTFLTGAVDGFGVDLNATFIDSEVTVFERENENLPFFRQPDKIFNAAFYYEKHGLSARIAYNYQSGSLRELGPDSLEDIFNGDRFFIDAQASYRITQNLRIYAIWRNITNERDERYIGDKNRMDQANIYGSDLRAGIRFNF